MSPAADTFFNSKNSIVAYGVHNHKEISKKLKSVKSVIAFNLNMDSLKAASVIKSEYPEIDFTILDPHKTTNSFNLDFGKEITKGIIDFHKKNGIKFIQGKSPLVVQGDHSSPKTLLFENSPSLTADLILIFPESFKANRVTLHSLFFPLLTLNRNSLRILRQQKTFDTVRTT